MSRNIKTNYDERGNYMLTTLSSETGCRWRYNDVCCNADNQEKVADFVFEEECTLKRCPYYTAETPEDVEKLKEGIKLYA